MTLVFFVLIGQSGHLVKAYFSESISDLNIGNIVAKLYRTPIEKSRSELYFVGDVMLARHVETLTNKYGINYPYQQLNFFDKNQAFLLGNFEATIPAVHTQTPDFQFQFSVANKNLSALREAGFTHFSQANNHAFDFGGAAYDNAKNLLTTEGLTAFGHPTILSTSSVSFIDLPNYRLAIVALSAVDTVPSSENISEVLTFAKNDSDFQIVFIHWGNEYQLTQSNKQRNLAKNLVAAGADLIVGHHPHVTQGIEKIGEAYVFYSLGNFIFDQYFSTDVREGLVLKLVDEGELKLSILPVTSEFSLAQPRLMNKHEKNVFLTNLTKRSSSELLSAIIDGEINLTNKLATSSEKAIMAP